MAFTTKTSAKIASALHSNLNFVHHSLKPNLITTQSTNFHYIPIRCGPRSNRGPLVKGRILSIEAIQAIQSLKRAQNTNSLSPSYTSLSRLLKADLLAALRELLRQGECAVALHLFSFIRLEYPDQDLGLLVDMISALGKNGMRDEIDRLINELEEIDSGDEKGLLGVIRGMIGTGSKTSTVRICEAMERSGVGSSWKVDEYVGKVLSKGLRGFGEFELANEVEREFCWDFRGNLESSVV